jgi:hypothetical protein
LLGRIYECEGRLEKTARASRFYVLGDEIRASEIGGHVARMGEKRDAYKV